MAQSTDLVELPQLSAALKSHGVAVPYSTLWRLVTGGVLPAQRLGRQWFVDAADVPEIARRVSSMPSAQRA